jgi:hypothetical protein
MSTVKRYLLLLTLLAFASHPSWAKKEKKAPTEQGLVNRIQSCLSSKDAYCYIDLWPDLDTLTKLAMKYSDSSSTDFREAYMLQENPVKMMHADSLFKARLKSAFDTIIAEGEEIGVHWESIVPLRYELVKQRQTKAELYEKLAPTRFVGYIFFVDATTRRTFGFMAGDIMNINGGWWGGRIRELYEASTRDEWDDVRHYMRTHKKQIDSTRKATSNSREVVTEEQQELNQKSPEVIADRKYYVGKFDAEIPVQLYLRALKGGCPSGICSWEAIYKFGDQDDYVKLDVTKSEDGKWHMVEDPLGGVMELEQKGAVLIGDWDAPDGQTGYDVKLTEVPANEKRIKRLDDVFAEMKGKK